jgi:hypothetical protein
VDCELLRICSASFEVRMMEFGEMMKLLGVKLEEEYTGR